MKTLDAGVQCGTRIQQLGKRAKVRARFTSVHLLLLAFAVVMAFGAVMKVVNS
jgi:hypothetical protein